MDPQVPTSFIPKKSLVGEAPARAGIGGLVMLIAILLFIVSIVGAGGAFAYGKYLKSAIADKDASLKKAEGAFDTQSIEELERLDSRLTQAGVLLQSHIAPSGIFTFLSADTLERVQFTSMNYELQSDGSGKLSLGGVTDSFSTLALQSDQFSAAKVLRDVIFSNIQNDQTGRITFAVSAIIDPSVISYAKQNGSGVSQAPTDAPTQN